MLAMVWLAYDDHGGVLQTNRGTRSTEFSVNLKDSLEYRRRRRANEKRALKFSVEEKLKQIFELVNLRRCFPYTTCLLP